MNKAAELRKSEGRVNPFQYQNIKKLKEKQKEDNAFEPSPGSGNNSFRINGHRIALRVQFYLKDCQMANFSVAG